MGVNVSQYKVGDAVFGQIMLPVLHYGIYAEYLVAPESAPVAMMPRSTDFVHAAALPSLRERHSIASIYSA
jgi:NADPH:quinone reductase-like Zn-dependent oxidoreductase